MEGATKRGQLEGGCEGGVGRLNRVDSEEGGRGRSDEGEENEEGRNEREGEEEEG